MTNPTDTAAELKLGAPLRSPFSAALVWLAAAARRQRTRRQLADLDAAALDDIGLTREAATREAQRPFWR